MWTEILENTPELIEPNKKWLIFIDWLNESHDGVSNIVRIFQEYIGKQPHPKSLQAIALEIYYKDMKQRKERLAVEGIWSMRKSLGLVWGGSRQFVLFLLSLSDPSERDKYWDIIGNSRFRDSCIGGEWITGIRTGLN
jgi:hypothetical protein